MLVQCPKCHFSQPEDQYCAQCGVNMLTYKPPRPPVLKRIFGNMFFQIVGILALSTAAIFFLLHRHTGIPGIAARGFSSQKIKSSAFIGQHGPGKVEAIATGDEVQNLVPESAAAPVAASATALAAPAEGAVAKADAKTKEADKKDSNPAALATPKQIKITYAEITNRGFDILTEESRSQGQFNSFSDYAAGVVPHIAKRLAMIPRDFKVIATETIPVDGSRALQAGLRYRDRNREPASADMQFMTNVHLDDSDGTTRAELEVLKVGAKGERANYPMSFDVMSETGYFVSGLHHGKSSIEAESTIDSELVVLVEFQR